MEEALKIALLLLSALPLTASSCASSSPTEMPTKPQALCPAGKAPRLVISTSEGKIVAEIFESAAPKTVRRIADLAGSGYYDGLTFNYTKPHIEIISSNPEEEDALLLEKELDAGALGLDQMTVENADRAVDIFQFEIFPAFTEGGKQPATPRMEEWLKAWDESNTADFLLGASRQEINEAMGYVYKSGFESRPVTKGSLTLKPASQTQSTPRLSIALRDLPERTGRHVVIGHVTEGFELADDISIRPLDVPPGQRSYDYRPREPVVIDAIQFECRKDPTKRRRNP